MKNIVSLLIVVLLGVSLTACKRSKQEIKAQGFEEILEAHTGQDHKLVKQHTSRGNFAVYKNLATGEYIAYNMDTFVPGTVANFTQYLERASSTDIVRNLNKERRWVESGHWEDIYETRTTTESRYDSSCSCYQETTVTEEVYVGRRWVDTSSYKTFYVGGGFVFNNTSGVSKDLETIEGLKEQDVRKFVAAKLKSDFSFSAGRADEMAKTLTRYQKLENSRELTLKEKDYFTHQAFGVDYKTMESALEKKAEGREEAYKSFIKKAAETNKVSHENIDDFFEGYLN